MLDINGNFLTSPSSCSLVPDSTMEDELRVTTNNSISDVYDKVKGHPMEEEIKADLLEQYVTRSGLAMVDSNNGITNLHVPSDVIIDASMPNVIRDRGQMWNKDDNLEEVKCVIPDRSYAGVYGAIVKNCQEKGQFDYTSTGHVSNVVLMAQKSKEYRSHDKTFEIGAEGTVIVTNDNGDKIFEHDVEAGNIRDSVVKPHTDHCYSKVAMELVNKYLADHDSSGCENSAVTPHDHSYASGLGLATNGIKADLVQVKDNLYI